ncbi:MAG: DUF433 domain-containing protein [Deltaproteobacteria bacterium]|nr:DUF433 domain-containing protein [Deltaproteobacteria bacterium]
MNSDATPAEVPHPYVECRPDVQGGRPVIKGSRFPVSSIVQDYRRGLSVEEILREFPQLMPAEVHDALSYYYDHRPEIEQEIAQMTDLDTAMRQYPPTLPPSGDGGYENLP